MAQTRAAYDTVAASYAQLLPDVAFEAPLDLAMIADFVEELPRGAQVLDAGCGAGRMLTLLADLEPSLVLTGADLSPGMVAQARSSHPGVAMIEAANASLPFPDGEFDGILAWYSIIHTQPGELGPVVSEFRRVLRSGGVVLLGFQAGTGVHERSGAYGHEVGLLRSYLHETDAVATRLERSGFRILARLDRAARPSEKDGQGFVLAQAY
ncbi:hypothetical protein AX769_12425 [Frondihabitans sp. PAMC 28766]|nr:hypothetical protein AX769_12425 [Frondihabitans sp. PAMC 28766]